MFLFVLLFLRPNFYPPSYEDSTDPEKQMSPLPFFSTLKEQENFNMPPPPYSKTSTEFISETNEQEQPPPYKLPVEQLQEQQTGDQDSAPEWSQNLIHPHKKSSQQEAYGQRTSKRAMPVRTSETGSG